MRVALIGAGNIAMAHAPAIQAIDNCEIVAVCDKNATRARSTAENLGNTEYFTETDAMYAEARPDVIHILTPPGTHFSLGLEAISNGCHVIIEKPFSVSSEEAKKLLNEAESQNVRICVGHNMVFDVLTQKACRLVADGKIGNIVSVEASFRFDPNRYPAVRADGAQYTHWIYQLHGGPLQDLIPHPVSLVLEFLDDVDDVKSTCTYGRQLPEGWPEEVRAILRSGNRLGYISVSLREKPETLTCSIYGDDGAIHVDYFSGILTTHNTSVLPRAVNRLLFGYRSALQAALAATGNIFKIVFRKFDTSAGQNQLIRSFYDAIQAQGPDPLSKASILNNVKVIESIWPEPSPGLLHAQERMAEIRSVKPPGGAKVLVTGASGFIGSHLLKRLAEDDITVRALVRPNSINAGKLLGSSVEIAYADLADRDAVAAACEGIETIYHAGASTDGDWKSNEEATIKGTQNILAAAKEHGVNKIVHLSTLTIYELLDKAKGAVIDENSGYQLDPRKMGPYAYCKIEAEKLIRKAIESDGLNITVLRPGMVIGEGGYPFFPHFGFNLGGKLFLTIGKGDVPLPFTYVGHVVDAMVRAANNPVSDGQTYNVVDDEEMTAREYLNHYIEVTGVDARVFRLPYVVPYMAIGAYEVGSAMGVLPKGITSRAQLKWKQAHVTYDTAHIKENLGWYPTVKMTDAMERTFRAYARKYLTVAEESSVPAV